MCDIKKEQKNKKRKKKLKDEDIKLIFFKVYEYNYKSEIFPKCYVFLNHVKSP
jgi:isopropylmalate/homocitrate/citramalate synthase